MKAFFKRWWPAVVVGAIVGFVVWRMWPKTVRRITFTDLPVISGDSITSDNSSDENGGDGDFNPGDSISDYDSA